MTDLTERLRGELRKQMDEQDDTFPDSMARQQGLVWLEGWFNLSQALDRSGYGHCGFRWPEPKQVLVKYGAKLNPARVSAAFHLINDELVISEQFKLVEMMLEGTEYTVASAKTSSPSLTIPSGCKITSLSPTKAMVEAAERHGYTPYSAREVWIAMHAEAPHIRAYGVEREGVCGCIPGANGDPLGGPCESCSAKLKAVAPDTGEDAGKALFGHEMAQRGVIASWDDLDDDEQAGWRESASVVLAATTLETLTQENARLREAMKQALNAPMIDHNDSSRSVYGILRKALGGGDEA